MVFPGLGGGVAEEHAGITKHVHGRHDPVKVAFTAPLIRSFPEAFNAYGRNDIAHRDNLFRHSLINKAPVSVHQEGHIIVLFEDIEYVLQKEGLTTGNSDEIDAHLFSLVEDPV